MDGKDNKQTRSFLNMNQSTYNALKSFIWGIANDCLVDVYDVGDYRKVILPMLVIRRFDAVLEPKHEEVVAAKKRFEEDGVTVDIDPALCGIAGQAFVNKSDFTLRDLRSRTNQQQLRKDFIDYLDGFSKNVQEIINKFHFRDQIPRLSEQDRLGLLIEKFVDPSINLSNKPVLNEDGSEKLEALDNHTMGTLFEEVIRMFNEQTNVTDAGRHFTPRDIIELMADLAFIPIQDKIQSTTYRIYDGACGTGGMLTVGESCIQNLAERRGKKVSINLFGQENFDETYAIACADMLLKGEGTQVNNIFFGSTISNDGFPKDEFDFMLSNPPFGTSWKAELKAWGDIKKDEITDPRFIIDYDGNPEYSLIPDIGDPQMLFLANNISKMKRNTDLGSRIIEVHNSSSISNGSAGSGSSNLRRYIIENDMLEAIVALPENMFYNTGISTFLWVVTNHKEERRKGYIQLIDASSLKKPLRKNVGEKNSEISPEIRRQIINLYLDYKDADSNFSKIFSNKEFGYYSVDIQRPLRLRVNLDSERITALKENSKDKELMNLIAIYLEKGHADKCLDFNLFMQDIERLAKAKNVKLTVKRKKAIRDFLTEINENAEPVLDSKGKPEPDKNLKDTEQIPLLYEGGVECYWENEIKPYVPDSWIDKKTISIGYELSFTKYFYKPLELRTPEEIVSDIQKVESNTDGLLASIIGGVKNA
ncbi:type I restriction-modification system subunit M [Mordavella massiliensis]|nr:class I SAM-dependent DNA methyltransferase [Mordavella massiliensis]